MEDRRRIAAAVRDYIARNHLSRDEFAFRTKLGKSTVDKFLIGLFSDRTLAIVEDYTRLTLREMLEAPAPQPVEPPARIPAGPSIAVLPFTNLGSDPAQEFLADGLSEDIATALSRLRWLLVIARSSTAVYRGRTADVRDVCCQLDVRYVLEGSVRAAGDRLRVTAQLVDAATATQIWAERYDRDLHDIFALQDDITSRVVAAVEPHLYIEEGSRALLRPDSIDAWGLVVRAIDLIHRVDRARNDEARAMLRRATALDPGYARAHALLGWATWWATLCYWVPDTREGYREAAAHAEEALQLDANDPWARMVWGLAISTAGQHDRALGELTSALTLNPNFALGHTIYGWALLRAGQFDAALAETAHALRLSPLDSFSGLYTSVHGLALLVSRRFDEALPYLRSSVAAFTGYVGHYHTLISCCGHLGRLDEARDFIAARNRIGPPLHVRTLRENLANYAHCDVFVEGLVKAGVPE